MGDEEPPSRKRKAEENLPTPVVDRPYRFPLELEGIETYRQHLSPEAVEFLFSDSFVQGLNPKGDYVCEIDLPIPTVVEEFRRFLFIKVFVVDTNATKISPTPIMDTVWHAAILNTKYYADLQAALGMTIHHDPVGANDDQSPQRMKRLSAMVSLYKTLFDTEPVDKRFITEAPLPPNVQIYCRTKIGEVVSLKVHQSDTMSDIKLRLEGELGIAPPLQRLIFGGKQAPDCSTMSDINMKAGDTIHLLTGLRGC